MRDKIIGLIVIFALALLAAPLPADTQQARKISRIGFLYPGSKASGVSSGFLEAFRQGLREYGWVEGQNIGVEYRYAEGKYKERFPLLASELVNLKVDLIVASTTAGTQAAMQGTTTIPIVFNLVADPVTSGFVTSLARPGGHVTGLSHMSPELAGKQLEMLTEVKPGLSRVAFLGDPDNPGVLQNFQQMQRDAQRLGLTLLPLQEMNSRETLEQALATIRRERAEAIYVHIGVTTFRYRDRIVEFTHIHKLPSMSSSERLVSDGLLMFYWPSNLESFRRLAFYVDKILRGSKPADLPVEQPTKFDLVINLKTAKALGITIPPIILYQADKVIR